MSSGFVLGALLSTLLAAALGSGLPEGAAGWKAAGPPDRYDAASIFDYIDGHGEVFLAYGMTSCTARRLSGPPGEGEILVDLFELGSPEDAYGLFTHAREGEPAGVGEESSFGAGTLAFWKGKSFVSITVERPTERSRAAALALGRAEAEGIAPLAGRPALVARLPKAGLDERSVVYLRHPVILAAHLDVGEGNPLGIGPDVPAALGRYRRASGTGWALVVRHRSDAEAGKALRAFAAAFLEKGEPARRGAEWWAAARIPASGGTAGVALAKASTKELAAALVEETGRREGGAR